MHPSIVGALLNSALYLLCCFVAGIVFLSPLAWQTALAAMGVTYVCYALQCSAGFLNRRMAFEIAAMIAFVASVVLGIAAGLLLLLRM